MKYLIFFLIILIALLTFCLWYKNRETENLKTEQDKNFETKALIRGLSEQMSEVRKDVNTRLKKDTMYIAQVKTITNNFKQYYAQIDTTTHFDGLIDELLTRHSQVQVQRDY
jgi:Flp pilus assembly protein TadB